MPEYRQNSRQPYKISGELYKKPLNKDEAAEEGDNTKYRLPFAICKKKGIKIEKWWTPRDAWSALSGLGVNPDDEYKRMYQKKASYLERHKVEKEKKRQARDTEHSPDYNITHVDGEIAGVRKGEPMTFEQADGNRPNPYFERDVSRAGDLFGYTTNCQTCVAVFEARLRGYDVRALPNNRNGYIKDLSRDTTLAWIDPQTGKKPSKTKMNGGTKMSFLEKNVQDGARYTIEFMHGRTNKGHIVSIERENGELRMYDPQTGAIRKGVNIENYLAQKPKLSLLRIDNLAFNDEFADHIMKKKG